MEEVLIKPNLNADAYRNMTAADRAPVPDTNLQFLLILNENNAILGASNMTDRYWSGTIWHYNDISNFNKENGYSGLKTVSGVSSGAFLGKEKFVVGEDSGLIQIIEICKIEDKKTEIKSLEYSCQHDDSIMSLSAFSGGLNFVSCSMDYSIKIWDATELTQTNSYHSAHTNIVTCVDTMPNDTSKFVSTALDKEAVVWDIRQSKPAKCIFKSPFGLTSASWNQFSEYIIAIGSTDGTISIIDIRNENADILHTHKHFKRPIHRLLYNNTQEGSHQLACCCDDTFVKVLHTNKECTVLYENNNHLDFVRGLTWYENSLYTCSWDNTVQKHDMLVISSGK